jgi:hypothetical protein
MTRCAVWIGLLLAAPASACTIVCGGLELKPTFNVNVQLLEMPLESAEVRIDGPLKKTFRTNRDGTVKIGPLPAGVYSIRAYKLGLQVASECAVMVSNRTAAVSSLKLAWSGTPEQISGAGGRLIEPINEAGTRKLTRKPLPNTKVLLSGFQGGTWESVTDADGRFKFSGVPDGLYTVRVSDVSANVVRVTRSAGLRQLELLFFPETNGSCGAMILIDPSFFN